MRPLDHNQVAPIGFLIGEKLFVSLFGDHDWNYRLFPAILAAIAVFEASKLPLRRVQYILLVVLLFLNPLVLRYTVEVKQYIADMLLAVVMLRLLIGRKYVKTFLVLSVAFWFSNISYLMLPAIIFAWFPNFTKLKQQLTNVELVLAVACCLVSAITYYLLFVSTNTNREAMKIYWSGMGGIYAGTGSYPGFLWQTLLKYGALVRPFWDVFALAGLSGFFTILWFVFLGTRVNTESGRLCLGLVTAHIICSFLGFYPAETRLIIYMAPIFCYLIVCSLPDRINRKWAVIAVFLLQALPFFRKPLYPYTVDNTRRYLQFLESKNYPFVYTRGGSNLIAGFYVESLQRRLKVVPLMADELPELDPSIPVLIINWRYEEFSAETKSRYTLIHSLVNAFGIVEESTTYMLLPKKTASY